MNLIDLVSRDGRLSHTKIWANIGYAAATVSFVRLNWVGQAETEVWWAYLSCVAGAVTASKFLSLKYSGSAARAANAEEKS
ncbi:MULTISPECIES: hypothetical protein [Pseudomonadota]|uniref:Holin n=1 Tax=Aeromonas hydrophila TaxID=644 RepID=A0ABD7G4G3_AERHY|nr:MULTISPECIES: hypothetical protein [Gammaproteobacteria]ELQ8315452.1 hypothetical protein [Pseudomonas aeruginosa]MCU3413395.1 hypothetical protein [Enterobacter hormaechei subsp. steigerwaltii]RCF46463.1 hypothetical protein C6C11_17325 [Aeromonas hydrophila]